MIVLPTICDDDPACVEITPMLIQTDELALPCVAAGGTPPFADTYLSCVPASLRRTSETRAAYTSTTSGCFISRVILVDPFSRLHIRCFQRIQLSAQLNLGKRGGPSSGGLCVSIRSPRRSSWQFFSLLRPRIHGILTAHYIERNMKADKEHRSSFLVRSPSSAPFLLALADRV